MKFYYGLAFLLFGAIIAAATVTVLPGQESALGLVFYASSILLVAVVVRILTEIIRK